MIQKSIKNDPAWPKDIAATYGNGPAAMFVVGVRSLSALLQTEALALSRLQAGSPLPSLAESVLAVHLPEAHGSKYTLEFVGNLIAALNDMLLRFDAGDVTTTCAADEIILKVIAGLGADWFEKYPDEKPDFIGADYEDVSWAAEIAGDDFVDILFSARPADMDEKAERIYEFDNWFVPYDQIAEIKEGGRREA